MPSVLRRELLAIVRDTFDSIHGSFAKLRVQAMVPIPEGEGAAVSYKALMAEERLGRSEIYVEDLDNHVAVRPLLEGVDGPKENRELRLKLEKMSLSEIKSTLFDLRIDPEIVEGLTEGKSGYVREVLMYLEKRGRVDEFLRVASKNRPDIDFS
ncbi:MAG: hypothetical protein ACI85U_003965 [Candidatus Promineifilaceae bacterium]|jgi:hypothetical protein